MMVGEFEMELPERMAKAVAALLDLEVELLQGTKEELKPGVFRYTLQVPDEKRAGVKEFLFKMMKFKENSN